MADTAPPPAQDPAYPPPGAPYQAADQPPAYPPQAYPPQAQPQQYPPPPQAGVVVVTQQPAPAVHFGDTPVVITDSKGQQVTTQLEYRNGTMTWLIVLALFFFGFWCCACIPMCIDGFKDVYHISPTDGTVVGVYKRM